MDRIAADLRLAKQKVESTLISAAVATDAANAATAALNRIEVELKRGSSRRAARGEAPNS